MSRRLFILMCAEIMAVTDNCFVFFGEGIFSATGNNAGKNKTGSYSLEFYPWGETKGEFSGEYIETVKPIFDRYKVTAEGK